METLENAFNALKGLGLVQTYRDFSTGWLQKSPSYFSMLRASGRPASMDALSHLIANLISRHEVLKESRLGELRHKADLMSPLLKEVWRDFRAAAGRRARDIELTN